MAIRIEEAGQCSYAEKLQILKKNSMNRDDIQRLYGCSTATASKIKQDFHDWANKNDIVGGKDNLSRTIPTMLFINFANIDLKQIAEFASFEKQGLM